MSHGFYRGSTITLRIKLPAPPPRPTRASSTDLWPGNTARAGKTRRWPTAKHGSAAAQTGAGRHDHNYHSATTIHDGMWIGGRIPPLAGQRDLASRVGSGCGVGLAAGAWLCPGMSRRSGGLGLLQGLAAAAPVRREFVPLEQWTVLPASHGRNLAEQLQTRSRIHTGLPLPWP